MSECIWEELVQAYLTTNRAVLVSRQYRIEDADHWSMDPDLLAVDFLSRQIWLVEVSAGSNVDKIARKAETFEGDVVPRLKNQLKALGVVEPASTWEYGLWAFVRDDLVTNLLAKVTSCVKLGTVQSLEGSVFPWKYWDGRRSLENKTYSKSH